MYNKTADDKHMPLNTLSLGIHIFVVIDEEGPLGKHSSFFEISVNRRTGSLNACNSDYSWVRKYTEIYLSLLFLGLREVSDLWISLFPLSHWLRNVRQVAELLK